MSSKFLSTTRQDSKCASDLEIEQSNSNSIDPSDVQDEMENYVHDGKKEVDGNPEGGQTFLTVEDVSEIIENAMKKQRSAITILAK